MSFTRQIKVKHVGTYRDGGTKHFVDSAGNSYYEDNRIGTTTPKKVYDKYPGNNDAIGENVELEIVTDFSQTATIA